MRFHLVFQGQLPASANKSKPADVARIRDQFHPQLKRLWEINAALKRLRSTAIVSNRGQNLALTSGPFDTLRDPDYPLQEYEVDLCAPIDRGEKRYRPLVRRSLDLNCTINVLFLRQEDPGSLVLQGGDLDGRIKTLCDALTIPLADNDSRYPQAQNDTYCLLESDTLISGLNVKTGRLLLPETEHPKEVQLVVEVDVRVLQVGEWNVCLLGD